MKLSQEDKKNIAEASERHRLYLLAKNDYERFKRLVGPDKAKDTLESLLKSNKYDSKLCISAKKAGIDCDALYSRIARDAKIYAESPAVQPSLNRMKVHLAWALLTYIILLITAVYLCLEPWMNGNTPSAINNSTATDIGVACGVTMLLFVWNKNIFSKFYNLYKTGFLRLQFISGKDWLSLITASLLFIGASRYLMNLSVDATDAAFCSGIAVSVVAVAHILLVLDCMVGLSPRMYYFGGEGFVDWVKGWFKGKFSLDTPFTPSLSNSYNQKFCNYDDIYRQSELFALSSVMCKKFIYLGNGYGKLEFHPSRSLKFIGSYILVDILHTACIIAWMVTLCHVLADVSVGHSIFAAVISCAVIYVLLNRPVYATNNFHWHICRNLYAYKVSHLFRKLFFCAILIGGIIALSSIN